MLPNKRGSPPDSLARRAAKRGVTQKDVARHAGVNQPTVHQTFRRDRLGSIPPQTHARYALAIDAAVAEREAIAKSAAEWLAGEIAAGRLSKKPSQEELRLVASIVRTAVGVNGR